MGLKIHRTVLIQTTSDGVIKVTPQGGRAVLIKAGKSVKITDRSGKALTTRRRKR